MRLFEQTGAEDFSDQMIYLAASNFLDDPVLADNAREMAAEHLSDTLGIDMPSARGVVWEREDYQRELIDRGEA